MNYLFTQEDYFITSRESKLLKNIPDTAKARIYIELAEYIIDENEWIKYNNKALDLANERLKVATGKEKIFYYSVKANALGNLGYYHDNHGNQIKSINYYFESLSYYDKANDKAGKAAIFGNLGVTYTNRKDYKEALDYLYKALELKIKYDPNHISKNYTNIGVAFSGLGEMDKALLFYNKGLEAAKKEGNRIDMSTASNNIGTWYFERKEYAKAKPFLKMSMDLCIQETDEPGAAWAMSNLANCYLFENNLDSSYYYLIRAEKIAKQYNYPDLTNVIAEKFTNYFIKKGDYKNAFEQLIIAHKMKDKISNVEAQKIALRQKMEYDNNLKETANRMKRDEEKKRGNQILYFVLSVLLVTVFLGIFIYNRLRITRKQKEIIENQKMAVDKQKSIIEEKNEEILSSIKYAQRVQEAILPSIDNFRNKFEDFFLFHLPKDIVAGDFYWFYESEDFTYVAVADCTGHGVPGALISVVCANALEKVVMEIPEATSGEILDEVTRLIISGFEKTGSDVKDGMDIAFCKINKNQTSLSFAGAYNSLLIVRDGELIELKGSRRPVGKHIDDSKFESIQIELFKKDWIYLYSDGFQDQFGEVTKKKFKPSVFKSLVVKNSSLKGEEQRQQFKTELIDWKGSIEQIDDICILGIQI